MKKITKYFLMAALVLAAVFVFTACDALGGSKKEVEQLTADKEKLQQEYNELYDNYNALNENYSALNGQYAVLQESGKTFFEIAAPSSCTVSPPLCFNGAVAGENPYADLSSSSAQYSAQTYAALKTPAFMAGRDVYYRFTSVFMQTGMYTLTFGFANLKALDMAASIKALFRLYTPGADGANGMWQDNSLFLLSSVGENRIGVMVTMQVTAASVNKGFTFYMGYSISNSGLAPTFTGKAFSADSLAIKVAKTA